jgi:ERCC4-related helicase
MTTKTKTTNIIDNVHYSLGDFIKESVLDKTLFRLVSAYFTLSAFSKMEDTLNMPEEIRFLFGEPTFVNQLTLKKQSYQSYHLMERGLKPKLQLAQQADAGACSDWLKKENVHVRSIKQQGFMHGKMYHMERSIGNNEIIQKACVGSGNFTLNGLGLSSKPNLELNLVALDPRDNSALGQWFDNIWNDESLVSDVKQEMLDALAKLCKPVSPQLLYYKTLYELFKHHLDNAASINDTIQRSHLNETTLWSKLYDFQKHGVKLALRHLEVHNGCILADSVGLGKTFEALAVIKHYELRGKRVLVLCPKKLEGNWKQYHRDNISQLAGDSFGYSVRPHTLFDTQEAESFNWGSFDLIVIDESHHFRNETSSRYQQLLKKIKQYTPKVLLLSATPVNNSLDDFKNQLHLITCDRPDSFKESLGISDYKQTMNNAQKAYLKWAKQDMQIRPTFSDALEKEIGYFKLSDELIIARSRKHIETYYQKDMGTLGAFPKRLATHHIYTSSNNQCPLIQDDPISYEKLSELFDELSFNSYRLKSFVRDEYKSLYTPSDASTTQREGQLVGLIKIGLFKRLESSIHSFRESLNRIIAKLETLKLNLKKGRYVNGISTRDIDFHSDLIMDDDDGALANLLNIKLPELQHLNGDLLLKSLEDDLSVLKEMYALVEGVTPSKDIKLQTLVSHIKDKVDQTNPKVIVFTQYKDTAQYIYDEIREEFPDTHHALITGGGHVHTSYGASNMEEILCNFSPISKRLNKNVPEQQIDILIATDCISEGQNLQDCDQVVNYDIHWNPVRLVQRFGRVDRINSKNPTVQMVNFWPSPDLESYLKLETRIYSKSEAGEATLRGDAPIKEAFEKLDNDQFGLDEVISNEFTNSTNSLNDFLVELLQFLEKDRDRLDALPLGMFAVTDAAEHRQAPGIIWCFKHRNPSKQNDILNPANPYFLVYAKDHTTNQTPAAIEYTSCRTRAELYKLLSIYASLARPYDKPIQEWQAWGESQVQHPDELDIPVCLEYAIRHIQGLYARKLEQHCDDFSEDVTYPNEHMGEQVQSDDDLELVTWLLLK